MFVHNVSKYKKKYFYNKVDNLILKFKSNYVIVCVY